MGETIQITSLEKLEIFNYEIVIGNKPWLSYNGTPFHHKNFEVRPQIC